MEPDRRPSSRPARNARAERRRQSTVRGCDLVDGRQCGALARPAGRVRQMDRGSRSFSTLVARGHLGKTFPCLGRHSRLRICPDRQHHLEGSCRCDGRKRGAEVAAIGRSRGGLTTKLHAVVDAIGLPLRIHPTPGQYGDRPQAEALLSGLQGVGHVIADAAYDADPLRAFIADDLAQPLRSRPIPAAPPCLRSIGASTRNATKSNASSINSSASAESPCDARKRSPPSWDSSISHAP